MALPQGLHGQEVDTAKAPRSMGFGNSVGGAAHGFLQLVSYGLLRSGSQQPLCLFSAPAFIEEFLCPLLDFNIPFPALPTYSFLFIWVGKEYSE